MAAAGDRPTVTWIGPQRLEVDGTRFLVAPVPLGLADNELVIIKTPAMVRGYLDLLAAEQPRRIVEVGVKEGGSAALITLAAQPDRLLAVELAREVPPLLAELRDRLDGRLVTAFGLDQGDRAALTRVVDTHLPGGGIDLVIDDASHILGPTRTSFEVLFPRLRPGGLYVIEDWSAECSAAHHLARSLPAGIDFSERLAVVNQCLHILNHPDEELPPEARQALIAAGSTPRPEADTDDPAGALFSLLVEAAASVDATALAGSSIVPSRPLADMAVEAIMVKACSPEVIADVHVDQAWLAIRRGRAEMPLDDFRLDPHWTDAYGYLS